MPSSPSPAGPPLFGLKFKELNDDCLLEVFKYLPFNEKIRYQRVDSKWGGLLESIWTKQTGLVFKGRHRVADNFCRNDDHSFNELFDGVFTRGMSRQKLSDICYHLTRRCPRLKAVFWETSLMREERLTCLSNCSRLEHITLDPILLHGIEKLNLVKVKCFKLTFGLYTPPVDLKLAQKLVERETTPCLEFLDIEYIREDLVDKVKLLTPVLPYLKGLNVRMPYDNDWKVDSTLLETIANLGKNIEHFCYSVHRYQDEVSVETEGTLLQLLVKKMTKLESIEFKGCPANFIRLLSSEKLKRIVWTDSTEFDDKCLKMSPLISLKSLQLNNVVMIQNNLDEVLKIPQYFPRLEAFSITPVFMESFSFPNDYFSGLKCLKKLNITGYSLSEAIIQSMLENCPKLRDVTLSSCPFVSPGILTLFADYALLHLNRSIKVTVTYCEFERNEPLEKGLPHNLKLIVKEF